MDERRRLKAIYEFGMLLKEKPRIEITKFHREYSPYESENATYELIQKGFDEEYLLPPQLYCNQGIEVELIKNHRNPLRLYEEKLHEKNTIYAMSLHGDFSLLCFKKGASLLDYMNVIYPDFAGIEDVRNLEILEKGKLSVDSYPMLWDELDQKVYAFMKRNPRKSFGKIAGEIGVSWVTVRNRFQKILKSCKIFTSFFPQTYSGYNHVLLCFHTKYEIGFEIALKRLNRSSYLYKFNRKLIIILFVNNFNSAVLKFKQLEKEKIIKDLKVSIPIIYKKP
ncbi:MAG: AsnC family protein [Theionarchaea archaeon]|nr:AsnC family protein [Theionarchaea archaeon]